VSSFRVLRPRWLLSTGVILVVTALWLGWRAMQVRSALVQARTVLTAAAATPVDVAGLHAAQEDASADVRRAQRAVDDPVWRVAARVPVAGRSFAVTRDATSVAGTLVDSVLPPLLAGGAALQERPLLSGGAVDLGLLNTVSQQVAAADTGLTSARRTASTMPEELLPQPIADARTDLLTLVDRLGTAVSTGRQTLELAPAVLGVQEPRRYFVAVHNNAEVRGTGGLVGAYAVLRIDDGRIALDRVGTNTDFRTASAPVVDLGPEFSARYDAEYARSYWSAAVLTPDWPRPAPATAPP